MAEDMLPLANPNQMLYAADLTIRSKMSFLTLIKDKIRGSNRDVMFRETCFGHWLDIPYTDNEPGLVNLILQTQIPVDPDVHEASQPLVFNVGGFHLEFGREQFCLITGLRFGPINWAKYSSGSVPFRDRVFRHVERKSVSLWDFTSLFHTERFDRLRDEDAIRVCLVICLELIFNGREHTSMVGNNILRIVEDISVWNACPWGSYVWSTTYACIRNGFSNRMSARVLKGIHGTMPKWTFGGFIWSFKIWILETFAPHVRCWAHDNAVIPRALAWTKLSTFHVNEDAAYLLSSIQGHNKPIHPLRPKDGELAQDWYISSIRYFNHGHSAVARNVVVCDNGKDGVHQPPLDKGEKMGKHEVKDSFNGCVCASSTTVSVEERLISLESIMKEIQSDMQSLKKRVLVTEQKVQVLDYVETEDEDNEWHEIDKLLKEHQNDMDKKDPEVDDLNNLNELHISPVPRKSIDDIAGKVDPVESRVPQVDSRARSVFSYKSVSCDDALPDNMVFEDTANTGKSYCPQPYDDEKYKKTKEVNENEETTYVLDKERIAEVLTQDATGVNDDKKPRISREEFMKAEHYKRFLADREANKKMDELANNTRRMIRKGTSFLRDYKKERCQLKTSSLKREPSIEPFKREPSIEPSVGTTSDYCKPLPLAPWNENLTRDDPSRMYPVPSSEYYDLKRVAGLDGWRLSFSRDIIIREPFWNSLLCLDHTDLHNGWLHDEHISMWVDYMNETRPPNADWCMVDGWFIPLLMRGDVSELYGDGRRFKVSWGEVSRVFIPINNAGKHWTLGEFDIATGVLTVYDSKHGCLFLSQDILWVDCMIAKVNIELPLYLQRLGVFQKKGLDYTSYNITWNTFPRHLTPQQGDLYGDCGVFLCIFLYRLSHGLALEVGDPVQAALAYRERMTILVLQHKERVNQECESEKLRTYGGKRMKSV